VSPSRAVEALLAQYFDAVHRGDAASLRRVFHPGAHLYSAPGGRFADVPLEAWLEAVASRPSPASQGEAPSGRVLATDLSGPDCAFAKVSLRVGALRGTDYLTLLCLDGGWRIVSKTYRVDPAP
jgi:4-oxalocrotonate tautomerase